MIEDEEWLEHVHGILEEQIGDLRLEFYILLENVCKERGVTLEFPEFEDIFPSTPKKLWTGRMHDIYGQIRAYKTVSEFIGSHIQDDTDWTLLKPYLLGKGGNPSTE